jgi:hypothetical protein
MMYLVLSMQCIFYCSCSYILRGTNLRNSLYSSEELTTLQANNNPNTLNTRNFHPAVLLQNLPRTRRKSPQSYGNKHHLLYLSFILILQSACCEQNPGPRTPKYSCMICSESKRFDDSLMLNDSNNDVLKLGIPHEQHIHDVSGFVNAVYI